MEFSESSNFLKFMSNMTLFDEPYYNTVTPQKNNIELFFSKVQVKLYFKRPYAS